MMLGRAPLLLLPSTPALMLGPVEPGLKPSGHVEVLPGRSCTSDLQNPRPIPKPVRKNTTASLNGAVESFSDSLSGTQSNLDWVSNTPVVFKSLEEDQSEDEEESGPEAAAATVTVHGDEEPASPVATIRGGDSEPEEFPASRSPNSISSSWSHVNSARVSVSPGSSVDRILADSPASGAAHFYLSPGAVECTTYNCGVAVNVERLTELNVEQLELQFLLSSENSSKQKFLELLKELLEEVFKLTETPPEHCIEEPEDYASGAPEDGVKVVEDSAVFGPVTTTTTRNLLDTVRHHLDHGSLPSDEELADLCASSAYALQESKVNSPHINSLLNPKRPLVDDNHIKEFFSGAMKKRSASEHLSFLTLLSGFLDKQTQRVADKKAPHVNALKLDVHNLIFRLHASSSGFEDSSESDRWAAWVVHVTSFRKKFMDIYGGPPVFDMSDDEDDAENVPVPPHSDDCVPGDEDEFQLTDSLLKWGINSLKLATSDQRAYFTLFLTVLDELRDLIPGKAESIRRPLDNLHERLTGVISPQGTESCELEIARLHDDFEEVYRFVWNHIDEVDGRRTPQKEDDGGFSWYAESDLKFPAVQTGSCTKESKPPSPKRGSAAAESSDEVPCLPFGSDHHKKSVTTTNTDVQALAAARPCTEESAIDSPPPNQGSPAGVSSPSWLRPGITMVTTVDGGGFLGGAAAESRLGEGDEVGEQVTKALAAEQTGACATGVHAAPGSAPSPNRGSPAGVSSPSWLRPGRYAVAAAAAVAARLGGKFLWADGRPADVQHLNHTSHPGQDDEVEQPPATLSKQIGDYCTAAGDSKSCAEDFLTGCIDTSDSGIIGMGFLESRHNANMITEAKKQATDCITESSGHSVGNNCRVEDGELVCTPFRFGIQSERDAVEECIKQEKVSSGSKDKVEMLQQDVKSALQSCHAQQVADDILKTLDGSSSTTQKFMQCVDDEAVQKIVEKELGAASAEDDTSTRNTLERIVRQVIGDNFKTIPAREVTERLIPQLEQLILEAGEHSNSLLSESLITNLKELVIKVGQVETISLYKIFDLIRSSGLPAEMKKRAYDAVKLDNVADADVALSLSDQVWWGCRAASGTACVLDYLKTKNNLLEGALDKVLGQSKDRIYPEIIDKRAKEVAESCMKDPDVFNFQGIFPDGTPAVDQPGVKATVAECVDQKVTDATLGSVFKVEKVARVAADAINVIEVCRAQGFSDKLVEALISPDGQSTSAAAAFKECVDNMVNGIINKRLEEYKDRAYVDVDDPVEREAAKIGMEAELRDRMKKAENTFPASILRDRIGFKDWLEKRIAEEGFKTHIDVIHNVLDEQLQYYSIDSFSLDRVNKVIQGLPHLSQTLKDKLVAELEDRLVIALGLSVDDAALGADGKVLRKLTEAEKAGLCKYLEEKAERKPSDASADWGTQFADIFWSTFDPVPGRVACRAAVDVYQGTEVRVQR